MKTRLYEITDTSLLDSHPPRLIEAPSYAAAIRFVASKYKATIPSQKRVAELYGKGVTVEQITGAAP